MNSSQIQSALALHQSGRLDPAAEIYRQILRASPRDRNALRLLAILETQRQNWAEAQRLLEQLVAVDPGSAEARYLLGRVLCSREDFAAAIPHLRMALQAAPGQQDARVSLAKALSERGRQLHRSGDADDALRAFDEAVAVWPGMIDALLGRGSILLEQGRHGEALQAFEAASRDANCLPAFAGKGLLLWLDRRYEDAIASFRHILARDPNYPNALGSLFMLQRWTCDFAADAQALLRAVRSGLQASPVYLYATDATPADYLACARAYTQQSYPLHAKTAPAPPKRHERIRLAYLSADFREHATMHLMARMFELHDRSRFETYGISFWPTETTGMQERVRASFDHFIDVSRQSDRAVADWMRAQEIDIAVDLHGHTQQGRLGIFALRPAPVQVTYLGYPGTTGASFMDYIVADRTVIPETDRIHYAEKVVYLPASYQPNDPTRPIAARAPSREEERLPDGAFVFCCFNNSFKITPRDFALWMRLLRQVSGSVLWLLADNEPAVRNLTTEAERQGIAAARLIFARRRPLAEHLARHRHADVFLDTALCNAHTTASDALWAGLPVVTQMGGAFPGRVAASLLRAVGLPELVTSSEQEYEALALRLAHDQAALAGIKQKLAAARDRCPLFDAERFTRNIETAYLEMWDRHLRGAPPDSFAVGRDSPTGT